MKALNDLEKRIAEYSDTFDEEEAKMIRKRVQNAGADEVFNSMSTKELKEFAILIWIVFPILVGWLLPH